MTDDGVRSLIERVRSAINRHDLDAFLECFDQADESEHSRSSRSAPSGVVTAFAETGLRTWHVFPIFAGLCSTPVSPRMRPGASGGGAGIAPTEGGSTYSAS